MLPVQFGSGLQRRVVVPRTPSPELVAPKDARGCADAGGNEQLHAKPNCESGFHETVRCRYRCWISDAAPRSQFVRLLVVSSFRSTEKVHKPTRHRIFMATNQSICTQHQHGLTCKRKNHPIRPRLGEPNDIAANQTRGNQLPHNQSGQPSVLAHSCHAA